MKSLSLFRNLALFFFLLFASALSAQSNLKLIYNQNILAELTEPKSGYLILRCNINGAAVFVDKKNIGMTPMIRISLKTGPHQIVISKEGYTVFKKDIVISVGSEITLDVNLSKLKGYIHPDELDGKKRWNPIPLGFVFTGLTVVTGAFAIWTYVAAGQYAQQHNRGAYDSYSLASQVLQASTYVFAATAAIFFLLKLRTVKKVEVVEKKKMPNFAFIGDPYRKEVTITTEWKF